jgi:hypothetical protein
VVALFYLNSDTSSALEAGLVAEGHDVVTAHRVGLRAAPDPLHLLRASELGRVLVTSNREDFELLHEAWLSWSVAWGVRRSHAGILIVPQVGGAMVSRLARDISRFMQSGARLENALFNRRIGGSRASWERWRTGMG